MMDTSTRENLMSGECDTIEKVLQEGAARSGTGVALRMGESRLTYPELEEASRRMARGLLARGLESGDKVALAIGTSVLYPVAFFGIQRAAGVAVPVHPHLPAREIHYILDHSDARWLLLPPDAPVPEGAAGTVEGILRLELSGELTGDGKLPVPERAGEELPRPDAQREGVLIYTSGTTGVPKGVRLTQANIVSNARAVVAYLGLRPEDRHAVVLPLFYSYAMSQMLSTLLAGGEVVLLDGLVYPAATLEGMAHQAVTVMAGVPTTYNLLVRLASFDGESLPHLRLFLNAGGPVHPDRLDELCRRFPRAQVINNYGCTEAGPRVTYLPHAELHRRGSIGIAIPGVQVTLRDEQGRRVGPGELGEIHITGPGVMKGYYKNELETRRVLTRHGLRSGDWATVDTDGYLYFKGRKLDIINTGGEKVSAREVEDVLTQHPAVKEAAVIGVPDPILGEIVKAFIVIRDGDRVSVAELERLAARSLARHKVPRRFEFCKQLARTPSGKIRKIDLRGSCESG